VYGAGVLTLQQGDLEQAEPLMARAADLAQERHDRDLCAHVTDAQAIASFFGYSDPFALVTFTRLAAVCCLTGELDRAIALSEECLRISEELEGAVEPGYCPVDPRGRALAVRRCRPRHRGHPRLPADQGVAR
jgi:hypothetical protein